MEPTLEDRRQRLGRAIPEDLDVQVRKELGESGLSLAGLELEITVGVLIEDVAREEDDAIAQEPQHPDRAGRLRDRVFLVVLNRGLPSRPDQDLSGIRCLGWTERAIVGHRSRCHRARSGCWCAGAC